MIDSSVSPSYQLSHHELADVLRVTIRLGVMMLQSGAASSRADQAMTLVGQALGAERLEAYVTPTLIIATAYSGSEHRTQIEKPTGISVNMDRICSLMRLARNMPENPTPTLIMAMLDTIQATGPQYSRLVVVLAVGLACGAFAAILGAGPLEALAAILGAAAAQSLRMRMAALRFNPIVITTLCAALATAISLVVVRLVGAPQPRLGVIASVLLLVPGVPLVTSILDLTRFDLVSGLSLGTYAILIVISIGVGMLLILAWTSFPIL